MRRACCRPSCLDPATASLLVSLEDQYLELVDLTEPPSGHHHLCARHVERTSPPVGWTMVDARSEQNRLWAELPDDDAPPLRSVNSSRAPRRSSSKLSDELPFGTTGVDPARVFRRHVEDDPSDDLAAALDVSSPLLARAFSTVRAS